MIDLYLSENCVQRNLFATGVHVQDSNYQDNNMTIKVAIPLSDSGKIIKYIG